MKYQVAAISCGIYKGMPVLDLDYEEDSVADTDANFILTANGKIIEIQGTAEGEPFTDEELLRLMRLAKMGVSDLGKMQNKVLGLS